MRSIVQYLAVYWSNTLTQVQRDGWEVYAAAITRQNKLGSQIKLTGFNHFMRSNTAYLQAGETVVAAAPTFPVALGQEVVCSARIAELDGRLSDPFRSQSSVTA